MPSFSLWGSLYIWKEWQAVLPSTNSEKISVENALLSSSAALEDDGDITDGELSPDLIYKIKANGDGKIILIQGKF